MQHARTWPIAFSGSLRCDMETQSSISSRRRPVRLSHGAGCRCIGLLSLGLLAGCFLAVACAVQPEFRATWLSLPWYVRAVSGWGLGVGFVVACVGAAFAAAMSTEDSDGITFRFWVVR